jgi:uncharacterized membrane protein
MSLVHKSLFILLLSIVAKYELRVYGVLHWNHVQVELKIYHVFLELKRYGQASVLCVLIWVSIVGTSH